MSLRIGHESKGMQDDVSKPYRDRFSGSYHIDGTLNATAADFDGSRPLLVAIIDVIECQPGGDCEKVSPQEARLPRFLEIEFDKKRKSAKSVMPRRSEAPRLRV